MLLALKLFQRLDPCSRSPPTRSSCAHISKESSLAQDLVIIPPDMLTGTKEEDSKLLKEKTWS